MKNSSSDIITHEISVEGKEQVISMPVVTYTGTPVREPPDPAYFDWRAKILCARDFAARHGKALRPMLVRPMWVSARLKLLVPA
jgi:hypothetical protein